MKKILSFLFTLALLSSLSVIAFAEGESTGGNQAVKAHIPDPSWVLVIPADQTIAFLTEETDIVHHDCSIDNAKHIPADCTINASLTHTGEFTLSTDSTKKLPFTLNAFEEDVPVGTPVIVSQYWGDTNNTNCYSQINIVISRDSWNSAESGGTYTTPVTYTSELVAQIVDPADGGTDRG